MRIIPINLKEANAFVTEYHRHHKAVVGCKFCIGLKEKDNLIGVAICGRPVSRYLDDGFTLEINRLCTNGCRNACSKLYGACSRIAKEMGYKKLSHIFLKVKMEQVSKQAISFVRVKPVEKCGRECVVKTTVFHKN